MQEQWIVQACTHSHMTSGGLWWERDDYRAKVFHPACPGVILGFAVSSTSVYISSKKAIEYEGRAYTPEEWKAFAPSMEQEVIERALTRARENLARLQEAVDFPTWKNEYGR